MNEHSDEFDDDEEVSKSQKKREATALQDLGERLITLSDKQLKEIDMPESLNDAVLLARNIKARSGRKRQLQYIGKIMRNIDVEPIETFFAKLDNKHHDANKIFHQLERWRDRILAEGNDVLTEVKEQFPEVDMQRMRQLVRNANNSKNEKTSTRAKREIFQYLKELNSDN